MRGFLCFLLLFLPPSLAGNGDRVDCGIVPGERYWITTSGLVFPDGSVLEDWHNCKLAQGVTFALAWDESGPSYVIEVHPSCNPSKEEAKQLEDLVAKAKAALAEQGADLASVPVNTLDCVARRRVDIRKVY